MNIDVEVLHNGSINGVDIDRFKDNFSEARKGEIGERRGDR